MSGNDIRLGIRLTADGKGLVGEVKLSREEIEKLAKSTNNASSEAAQLNRENKSLAGSLGGVAAAVKYAAGAFGLYKLAELAKDSAMLAARFETMGIVMKVAGNNAGYTAKQMESYSRGLQQSGISMLESRNALAQLATAHIDLAKASQLGRAAQDLAVVANINSSEALARMIQGIKSGEVEILRTMGLNVSFESSYKALAAQLYTTADKLTEQQKTLARTNAALLEAKRYTGIYEEAMTTAGKAISSLTRYWENAKIQLGGAFLGALTTAVFGTTDALKAFNKEAEEFAATGKMGAVANTLKTAMEGVGQAIGIAARAARELAEVALWGTLAVGAAGAVSMARGIYSLAAAVAVLKFETIAFMATGFIGSLTLGAGAAMAGLAASFAGLALATKAGLAGAATFIVYEAGKALIDAIPGLREKINNFLEPLNEWLYRFLNATELAAQRTSTGKIKGGASDQGEQARIMAGQISETQARIDAETLRQQKQREDAAKKAADAYKTVAKHADDFIKALNRENAELGMNAQQKKLLEAGLIAVTLKTEKERVAVMAAASAYKEKRDALDEAIAAGKDNNALVESFLEQDEKARVAVEDGIKGLRAKIESIEEETLALTLSKKMMQEHIIAQAMLNSKLDEGSTAYIELKKRMEDAYSANSVAKAKAANDEQFQNASKVIEQSLTDALMRGFESGKNLGKNFADSLKNMFKTLVLRPIIQPIAQGAAGAFLGSVGMPGAANAAGASGGGGGGGAFGGGWLSNDWGSNVVNSKLGSMTGLSQEHMVDGIGTGQYFPTDLGMSATSAMNVGGQALGYVNAIMAARDGQWGKSIGSAVGTYFGGPIGGFIGSTIGGWVDSAFGGGGGDKIGASNVYRMGANGKTVADSVYSPSGGDSLGAGALAQGTLNDINATAISLGGKLKDTLLQIEYELDPKGSAAGSVGFMVNGKRTAWEVNGQDVQGGAAQIKIAAQRAYLQGLQDLDIGGGVDAILESVKAASATPEEISSIIQLAGAYRQIKDLMPEFGQASVETVKALADAAGGAAALQQAVGYYYQNFYTDAERLSAAQGSLGEQFKDLSITTVPATRDEFRKLMEAQDLTTDSGRTLYSALLKLAPAFISVTDAAAQAAKTAWDAQVQVVTNMRGWIDQVTGFIKGIDKAIFDIRLAQSSDPAAMLKSREADLWRQLNGYQVNGPFKAEDLQHQIDLAGQIKDTILQRYQIETAAVQKLAGFAQNLGDYVNGLKIGDLSPLSLDQRIAEAKIQYDKIVATLRDPNASAADRDRASGKYTAAADSYLKLQQQYNASGAGYVTAYDQVMADALALGADTRTEAERQTAQLSTLAGKAGDTITELQRLKGVAEGGLSALNRLIAPEIKKLGDIAVSLGGSGAITQAINSLPTGIAHALAPYLTEKNLGGTWTSTGGATYADATGMITGTSGASASKTVVQGWVNDQLAANDPLLVYQTAKNEGVSLNSLNVMMNWAPGTSEAWAIGKGLPTFAIGTSYVPQDMTARIHAGEEITPRPYVDMQAADRQQTNAELKEQTAELRRQTAELRDTRNVSVDLLTRLEARLARLEKALGAIETETRLTGTR